MPLYEARNCWGIPIYRDIPGAVDRRSMQFRAVARRSILQQTSSPGGVQVHRHCPWPCCGWRRDYNHARQMARIILVMTAARDELHRLVQ